MPTQVTDNATLEQLEAAPAGSTLKDGSNDHATKNAAGNWEYFGNTAMPFTSRLVHSTWPPIRLAQPEGADQ